jgi:predicted transcriptional regulator
VKEKLHDELASTTVLTILRTLDTKGYVGHEEEGRVHRYYAAVKETAARKSALRHLTGKLFKGSSELLFTHLVSDQELPPANTTQSAHDQRRTSRTWRGVFGALLTSVGGRRLDAALARDER